MVSKSMNYKVIDDCLPSDVSNGRTHVRTLGFETVVLDPETRSETETGKTGCSLRRMRILVAWDGSECFGRWMVCGVRRRTGSG